MIARLKARRKSRSRAERLPELNYEMIDDGPHVPPDMRRRRAIPIINVDAAVNSYAIDRLVAELIERGLFIENDWPGGSDPIRRARSAVDIAGRHAITWARAEAIDAPAARKEAAKLLKFLEKRRLHYKPLRSVNVELCAVGLADPATIEEPDEARRLEYAYFGALVAVEELLIRLDAEDQTVAAWVSRWAPRPPVGRRK
jgi:hypothetical protein